MSNITFPTSPLPALEVLFLIYCKFVGNSHAFENIFKHLTLLKLIFDLQVDRYLFAKVRSPLYILFKGALAHMTPVMRKPVVRYMYKLHMRRSACAYAQAGQSIRRSLG